MPEIGGTLLIYVQIAALLLLFSTEKFPVGNHMAFDQWGCLLLGIIIWFLTGHPFGLFVLASIGYFFFITRILVIRKLYARRVIFQLVEIYLPVTTCTVGLMATMVLSIPHPAILGTGLTTGILTAYAAPVWFRYFRDWKK